MEVREIKFLFHDKKLENSFAEITFSLPKEEVDKFEETIKSQGFDTAMTSLPIHILGTFNMENMLNVQTPADIYTWTTK